jgi:molybdate transport system regulatory protein
MGGSYPPGLHGDVDLMRALLHCAAMNTVKENHLRSAVLRVRIVFGPGMMLGPGKADLLALIRETGSIAAAGRRMGMSYKRAWMLVETMNAMFREPLVECVRGGASGGGAHLTEAGEKLLGHYRQVEERARAAAGLELDVLGAMIMDMSERK